MAGSHPTLVQLTAPIVSQVQIRDVFVQWSKMHRAASSRDVPETVAISSGFRVKSHFDNDAKSLTVETIFNVDGSDSSTPDRPKPVFNVEAAFSVAYMLRATEGIEDSHVRAFARLN